MNPIPTRATLVLALVLLAGCRGDPAPARHAVDTHPDDACAVCGMYLEDSPGPRAEAFLAGRDKPLVFDSTRDFFAYVLQPENQASLEALFVQDSTRIDWQHPAHAAVSFVDARQASYVVWQPLPGSMGPTLAPFASRAAAAAFVRGHGGAVLDFAQITPALVSALDYRCPARDAAAGTGLQCQAPTVPGKGHSLRAGPEPYYP
ncbi:nitrous oxide reductase accessory protein NosL [Frateuria soli]|uniref:nitrous oxide reductase accessory protein NosL n=1 Tax=Frateuria soli TaxID=1542730 RepID=UPI001E4D6FBB|nr:nitrous oxide reductase accessory protein NosL [Frateuria soli]UGB37413.1 nitrous oxide reductase accessory protein NosL [Frateuria soli]